MSPLVTPAKSAGADFEDKKACTMMHVMPLEVR